MGSRLEQGRTDEQRNESGGISKFEIPPLFQSNVAYFPTATSDLFRSVATGAKKEILQQLIKGLGCQRFAANRYFLKM